RFRLSTIRVARRTMREGESFFLLTVSLLWFVCGQPAPAPAHGASFQLGGAGDRFPGEGQHAAALVGSHGGAQGMQQGKRAHAVPLSADAVFIARKGERSRNVRAMAQK